MKTYGKKEKGKIVNSVVNGGKAFYRTGTGYVVHYNNEINFNYSIGIVYSLDVVRKNNIETSDKRHFVINDDMYVYLSKIPHA